MTNAREIAETYIATWNETDTEARSGLIARHWSDEPSYIDPLATTSTSGELSELIGGVHARFPGFRFRLIGTPDGHGDIVRLAWSLGPGDREAPVEGSDVVQISDGRIDRVIGFLDKVPAM